MATQKPVGIDQRAAQANSAYGNSAVHYDVLSVTSLATSDVLRLLRIPAGTRVDELIIICDKLDSTTSGALAVRIGYTPVNSANGPTADEDYFFPTGSTTLQAAGRKESTSDPLRFDYDVYVDAIVEVVPISMKAGDIHAIVRGEIVGTK